MSYCGRRRALRILGAGALLSATGFAFPAPARASGLQREVPRGNYRLTRLLERELVDGAMLSVNRAWSCRFLGAGRGMRVEGEALECIVQAPAALAALAEMEKRRVGVGPLPVLLDSTGLIAAAADVPEVEPRQVLDAAVDVLVRSKIADASLGEAKRALAQLANAAGQSMSTIPEDLFFPDLAPSISSREFTLGNDIAGEVLIEVKADAQPETGLLKSWERRVNSRIGDGSRLARELWMLEPA